MLNNRPARVLLIDLDKKKIMVEQREDLNAWLGGVGIATCLLKEHLLPEEDAYHPGQPVVIVTDPMRMTTHRYQIMLIKAINYRFLL